MTNKTTVTEDLGSVDHLSLPQAAALLNVSQPFVLSMIEKGELPARTVDDQLLLSRAAVLAYKADLRAKALQALEEIAAIDQELGLR